jgi:hypothetical protein
VHVLPATEVNQIRVALFNSQQASFQDLHADQGIVIKQPALYHNFYNNEQSIHIYHMYIQTLHSQLKNAYLPLFLHL